MLSNKSTRNGEIISVENEKNFSNDNEIVKVLNNFFSSIIKTLWISQKVYPDLFRGDIVDPRLVTNP